MADPKGSTTAAAKAPGPSVVEALANPFSAGFAAAALEEAHDALRARYADAVGEGSLAPMQKTTLAALKSLGAQIVTATTPVGGAA